MWTVKEITNIIKSHLRINLGALAHHPTGAVDRCARVFASQYTLRITQCLTNKWEDDDY